jgi:putative ATPase
MRGAALDAEAPLAERLRPHHLDEVIGQTHLLGPASRCAWPSSRAACIR